MSSEALKNESFHVRQFREVLTELLKFQPEEIAFNERYMTQLTDLEMDSKIQMEEKLNARAGVSNISATPSTYRMGQVNAHTDVSIISATPSTYRMGLVNTRTDVSIISATPSTYRMGQVNTRTDVSIISATPSTYGRRQVNAVTDVSIIRATPSTYGRGQVNARTNVSIISSSPSTGLGQENAPTDNSIISASPSTYGMGQVNGSTDVSIISAQPNTWTTKYDRRQVNARTRVSIVSAEPSTWTTKYEMRQVNARTGVSIASSQPSISTKDEYATDPITLTVEEKLYLRLDKFGRLKILIVQGTLSLKILNKEDGFIQVEVEDGGNPDMLFKTQPNINRELFFNESILCMKEPNMPFPSSGEAAEGVVLLNWKWKIKDKESVPLMIYCSSDASEIETCVSIKYEAWTTIDLRNVMISIPLPAHAKAPRVSLSDGEWSYDESRLGWSIPLIHESNRGGLLEFYIPPADTSNFFPVSVQFTAANTFSGLKVTNVLQLRDGPHPKFAQRTQLITKNYKVV